MKVGNCRDKHRHVSKASPLTVFGNGANARRQAEIDAATKGATLGIEARDASVLNQFVHGVE